MTRPSAPVLLEQPVDNLSHARCKIEILAGQGMWVLEYKNQPVAIRTEYLTDNGYKYKYPRTGFNNQAHAERLALQLNRDFDTHEFSIKRVL